MKVYFLSDLHLKSEDKDKSKIFLSFLSNIGSETNHLVLLGDVFDLWISNHNYFKNKFPKIIVQIKRLVSLGVQIHYFEGNHDLHLGPYWANELGVKVYRNYHIFQFGQLNVRVEHGDLMNPKDHGYKFLRWLLRTKPVEIILHGLPGFFIGWVGERSSRMSRIYTDRHSKDYTETVIEYTRNYAQSVFQKDPYDLLITGHTHVKDDFEFESQGRKARSINLGSWLDQPKTLLLENDRLKFIYFN